MLAANQALARLVAGNDRFVGGRARFPTVRKEVLAALAKGQEVIDSGLHNANHADVLAMAAELRISGYDARYLVVARGLGLRLVTQDVKLRKAAPALTQSIVEALAAAP